MRHHISILVLHHTRKAPAIDIFDQISGSTGLTGSADTIAVLQRSRSSSEAILSLTGRDIEEQELALRFYPKCGTWKLVGDAKITGLSKQRKAIIQVLRKSSAPMLPRKIAKKAELSRGSVRHLVRKLLQAGILDKVGDHKYTLAK
jgi:hypothetical protein